MAGRRATADGAAELSLADVVLRPVRDRNTFESTVEQLANALRLGVYATGERLPSERELAARLRVSRATLREAIGALRDAGMVEVRRGRGGGTVVTYAGAPAGRGGAQSLRRRGPELRDALDFRAVVEPGAAWLAARRDLSAEQRAALTAARQAVENAPDAASHRMADSRLHLTIATLSGSRMLVDAVTQAQILLHEMLTSIPVLQRNIAHSHAQHARIVAAILAGDAATARQVMEEHCEATSALLRGLLG
ncbi:MAG: GntR family transcriptional regulator [Acidothermus sp.]|nr:GntR family transcriptional regulator [Acidothermus sp.]